MFFIIKDTLWPFASLNWIGSVLALTACGSGNPPVGQGRESLSSVPSALSPKDRVELNPILRLDIGKHTATISRVSADDQGRYLVQDSLVREWMARRTF